MNLLQPYFHPYAIFGSGGADGADSLGEEWVIENEYDLLRTPIKEIEWKKYGKAAGRKRNERLFSLMKPDYGVMFPGGNGTAHMKSLFDAAGVDVFVAN
jgi:hypothetical protein